MKKIRIIGRLVFSPYFRALSLSLGKVNLCAAAGSVVTVSDIFTLQYELFYMRQFLPVEMEKSKKAPSGIGRQETTEGETNRPTATRNDKRKI